MREAGDLLMESLRQDQSGKQPVRAQRRDDRLQVDAPEHRFAGILRRPGWLGAQPVHPAPRHGARQHEHRQPGRVLAQILQIGRDTHGNAAKQTAVAGNRLQAGSAGFV